MRPYVKKQDGSLVPVKEIKVGTFDKVPVAKEVVADVPLGLAKNTNPNAQSVLNSIAEKISNFVTPEMYGAVGDGNADDTQSVEEALADCVNYGSTVFFENQYKCTQSITITSPITLMIGGTIHSYADRLFVVKSDVQILGSGYLVNHNKNGALVQYAVDDGVYISTSKITANMLGTATGFNTSADCAVLLSEIGSGGGCFNLEFSGKIRKFQNGFLGEKIGDGDSWITNLTINGFIDACSVAADLIKSGGGSTINASTQPWYGEKIPDTPFIKVRNSNVITGLYWDSHLAANSCYVQIVGTNNYVIDRQGKEVEVPTLYKDLNIIEDPSFPTSRRFRHDRYNYHNWPSNDLTNSNWNGLITMNVTRKNATHDGIYGMLEPNLLSEASLYKEDELLPGSVTVRFDFAKPRAFFGSWIRFRKNPKAVTFRIFEGEWGENLLLEQKYEEVKDYAKGDFAQLRESSWGIKEIGTEKFGEVVGLNSEKVTAFECEMEIGEYNAAIQEIGYYSGTMGYVDSTGLMPQGAIMQSPNGTMYRITVNDDGRVVTTALRNLENN